MKYDFRQFRPSNEEDILEILNFFVKNSFAAYPQEEVEDGHFTKLFESVDEYPFYVVYLGDKPVGFGLLRPYYKISTFKHTVEITYFILPDHTGKGLGSKLLEKLEKDAKERGIETILANVSSLNPQSMNFHLKYGFRECGRLQKVGRKFGKYFDVIWMQKML